MRERRWYRAEDGLFEIEIPAAWEAEPDEEDGGVEVWLDEGVGVLHLVGFPQGAEELPDPAEELYAFLEEQEIELEEDEVEDIALAEGLEMSVCEYVTEDEEDEDGAAFWLVGVASLPDALVFAHYTCPAGEEEAERDAVLEILRTMRSPAAGGSQE